MQSKTILSLTVFELLLFMYLLIFIDLLYIFVFSDDFNSSLLVGIIVAVLTNLVIYSKIDHYKKSPKSLWKINKISFKILLVIIAIFLYVWLFLGVLTFLIIIPALLIVLLFAVPKIWKIKDTWLIIIGSALVLFLIPAMFFWLLPEQLRGPPPACTGFSQIRIGDWKADSSEDKIVLILNNTAGLRFRLNTVSVDISGSSCTPYNPDIKPELSPGESYQVNVSNCTFPDVGDLYRAEMTISYTNLASGIEHKSVGVCQGTIV